MARLRQIFARIPREYAAIAAIVLIASGALGGMLYRDLVTARETTLQDSERELANMARILGQHATSSLETVRSVLLAVETRMAAFRRRRENPTADPQALNSIAERFGAVAVLQVTDAKGRVTFAATSRLAGPTVHEHADHFLAHKDGKLQGEYIGAPLLMPGINQSLIPVSRALRVDGRFTGIVVALIRSSYFSDIYELLDLGPERLVSLYRRDGVSLVHAAMGKAWNENSTTPSPLFQRNLDQVPLGLVHGRLVVNESERIIAYSRLEHFPAVIAVSITREHALAGWRKSAAASLRILIPSVVLVLLAGVVMLRQVRHRRRSSSALRENQEQLQRLVGNIPGVVFTLAMQSNGNARYTFLSDSVEKYTGYSSALLKTQQDPLALILAPERRSRVLAQVQAFVRAMRPGSADWEIVKRDGSTMWLKIIASPYRTAHGGVAVDGVAYDITETKRWQEQSIQAQRMQAIGQLTGGVAHEFNNLLMVIEGNIALLDAHTSGNPEIADLTRRIAAASRRGAEVTQRLLAFSLKQPLRPAPVDVNAIARELADLAGSAMFGNATLRLELAEDIQLAMADEYQLYNAILNLLINSRDAMPDGGEILVKTGNMVVDEHARAGAGYSPRPGDYVFVTVRDTGVGMAEEVRRRAFEPFFTTKDVGKGAGLGLSMVLGFARQSGGAAKLESAPGQGTTVTILLPTLATARAASSGGNHRAS